MQHADAVPVFGDFIREVRPERILEIGTAHGGLTMAMRDHLNEAGLSASAVRLQVKVRTYLSSMTRTLSKKPH